MRKVSTWKTSFHAQLWPEGLRTMDRAAANFLAMKVLGKY